MAFVIFINVNLAAIKKLLMPIEVNFQKEVEGIDKIVAGSFAATHHIAIFRQVPSHTIYFKKHKFTLLLFK